EPKPLVFADGSPSGATVQVTDDFESYENPKVVNASLTGAATAFEGAKSATLFLNRKKQNPTGEIVIGSLDPKNTYNVLVWGSRAASGKRWGKYTVHGTNSDTQFLAAGGDYDATGNPSEVLTFE